MLCSPAETKTRQGRCQQEIEKLLASTTTREPDVSAEGPPECVSVHLRVETRAAAIAAAIGRSDEIGRAQPPDDECSEKQRGRIPSLMPARSGSRRTTMPRGRRPEFRSRPLYETGSARALVPSRCHGGVRLGPFRSISVHFDITSSRSQKWRRRRRSYEESGGISTGGPNGIRTRVWSRSRFRQAFHATPSRLTPENRA